MTAQSTTDTKVAIVTGAAGGLGEACVRDLVARGYKVALNYLNAEERANAIAGELDGVTGAFARRGDVASWEDMNALFDDVLSRWGRIDVLVNNAGGAYRWLGFAGIFMVDMKDQDAWDETIRVNLTGVFNCIRAVAPHMIAQGSGHIVNVGSGTGIVGTAGMSAYAAAKSGVIGLTKVAARELGPHGVQVNTVCPGLIAHERLYEAGLQQSDAQGNRKSDKILPPIKDATEFAAFVGHLTEMHNISGQLLNIDSRII